MGNRYAICPQSYQLSLCTLQTSPASTCPKTFRRTIAEGASISETARQHGVSHQTIMRVRDGAAI